MSFRSVFGIDWPDFLIHAGITGVLFGGLLASRVPPEEGAVFGTMILTGSLVVLGVRRSIALRRAKRLGGGINTGEMAAERIAELEQRIADLEAAQGRVAELEERLDFAERLLAQRRDRELIGPGEGAH